MSAMSASPVKLPPPGVPSSKVVPPSVPPPVPASPPKTIPMNPSLTGGSPSKPANMNHTAMPLSLIAEHKSQTPYNPPQQQPVPIPPTVQPLPRTPEKPKEIKETAAPAVPPSTGAVPTKPTSNGVEGIVTNPIPVSSAAVPPEQQHQSLPPVSQSTASSQKPEASTSNLSTLPENHSTENSQQQSTPAQQLPQTTPPVLNTAKAEQPPVHNSEPAVSSTPVSTSGPVGASVAEPNTASVPPPPPPTVSVVPNEAASTPPAPASAPAPAAAPPSVEVIKSRTEQTPNPKPEMKVATIPRGSKRKREIKPVLTTPESKKESDERKSKRVRLPTQPYQSPLPELSLLAKMNKTTPKTSDDKLIVFYKNEFLAVRNAEGGFYVCQAMQNIYKSSPRIRIRWLSQQEGEEVYTPDFYDTTDFDCILTNLNLEKVDKEKFRLPEIELHRTESILKRALDVEKGVSEKPPVTEEHPDGLDLSLFRDESQLKKTPVKSRTKTTPTVKKSPRNITPAKKESSEAEESSAQGDDKKKKKSVTATATTTKTNKKKKKPVKKKPPPTAAKKAVAKITSGKNTGQSAKKKTNAESRSASKRKSSSAPVTQTSEKRARKSDTSSQPSEKTSKTRSAVVVAAKSRRDRRAKTRK